MGLKASRPALVNDVNVSELAKSRFALNGKVRTHSRKKQYVQSDRAESYRHTG